MDNGKDLIIFQARLVDGKRIEFDRNSSHIPTLDYVASELRYHITELRAMEKTRQEMKKSNLAINPNSLTDILRRGHKR